MVGRTVAGVQWLEYSGWGVSGWGTVAGVQWLGYKWLGTVTGFGVLKSFIYRRRLEGTEPWVVVGGLVEGVAAVTKLCIDRDRRVGAQLDELLRLRDDLAHPTFFSIQPFFHPTVFPPDVSTLDLQVCS